MIEGDYLTENCSEILSDKTVNTNIFVSNGNSVTNRLNLPGCKLLQQR